MCIADKKAQENGSNELPRSPMPQKGDVLLNSKSVHSTSAMPNLKLYLGITNRAFQKTSKTKTQDSRADKVLPLSHCKSIEQVSEKIGLHQFCCNLHKINLGRKMKMFQFDQDFPIPMSQSQFMLTQSSDT